MRARPHRLRNGQCVDCGHHDSYSAPDTCPRCALDRMHEQGHGVAPDPVRQFELFGSEMWRQVATGITNGSIKSGRFYLFAGYHDGGALELPMGDVSAAQWETASARTAQASGEALTDRYKQVWVVTTVGCWNVIKMEG